MSEVEIVSITWKRVFKIWWSLIWRCLAYIFLSSVGIGAVLGFIMELVKVDTEIAMRVYVSIVYIIAVSISFLVLRCVLKKKYSDFRIILAAGNTEI